MNEEERKQLEELGVSIESVQIYRYKEHKYQNLSDAKAYATLDRAREAKGGTAKK